MICSGPMRGKQQTYDLVARRVPPAPELTRDQAVGEFVRRYFSSHGPATPRDFAWWSGLTVADAKEGIAALGDELALEEDEHGRALYRPPVGFDPPATSGAHLIPMYDELGVAFKDLRMVYTEPPPEGVMARPMLIEGVTVGSWRRRVERRDVRLEATLITPLSKPQRAALEAAAERFGRFLELPVSLETRTARG